MGNRYRERLFRQEVHMFARTVTAGCAPEIREIAYGQLGEQSSRFEGHEKRGLNMLKPASPVPPAPALRYKTCSQATERGATPRDGGGQARLFPLTLSVIIVNWKVRDLLRDCLRSLYEEMLLPPEVWEIIVVDNYSGDDSVEMVRAEFPGATLLANDKNLGFGKANNQALRICRGKYILLLNPDTVVIDHALDRMVQMMEASPDVAALGCRLLNTDGSFQRWTGGNPPGLLNVTCHFLLIYRVLPARILPRPLYLEKEPGQDLQVGWVSGACLLLRREAIGDQIFNERFFLYGEDVELCERLTHAGWKVIYTPKARIIHHGGRSLDGQTTEIQVSKLRGLRDIFAMRNGRVSLLLYDVAVSIGFLLRCLACSLAARTRPGRGFEARAEMSRRFLAEAMRVLIHR
jgi:N-acetylglucosaminyl-diphospho-decaprenol L-rhamnosyltransferase